MTLESSDIQDSEIMGMSRQETNDKGRIKFLATLPSGRELSSEFFDPGKKREALLAWLPAVRGAILSDDEETRLAAKKTAALAQQGADKPAAKPVVVDARGELLEKTPDPADYVKRMVDSSQRDVDWAQNGVDDYTTRLESAQKALHAWKTVEASLGASTSAESTKNRRDIPVSYSGSYDDNRRNRDAVQSEAGQCL